MSCRGSLTRTRICSAFTGQGTDPRSKESSVAVYPFMFRGSISLYSTNENLQSFPLNHFFGVYWEDRGNLVWERTHPHLLFRPSRHGEPFKWEIFFTLTRLKPGWNKVSEKFHLFDQVSYFNGIHGYLLNPIVEN